MQWIPCSMIECRRFNAFWRNGSRLFALQSMQRGKMHLIEWSGVYAAWPKASLWNAVDSMHCDWMKSNPCSVLKCILIECSGFHAAWPNWSWLMHWITCGMIECTGFHAALWNTSRVNAVDCMQRGAMYPGWMQWNPCSMLQWIPMECIGLPEALCNWYQLSSGFHAV